MSCPEIRNALIHGMESVIYEDSMSDTDGRKRNSDQDDTDRGQSKKRRKQSNPIRITNADPTGENDPKMENSSENNGKNVASENNALGKIMEKSVTSFSPLAEDNNHEPPSNSYRSYMPGKENVLDNSLQNMPNESIFPLNLSNMKSSPKDNSDQSVEEKNWYKMREGRGLFPMPPLDPLQVKSHFFQNNVLLPPQSPTLALPNLKRIMVGNNEIPVNPSHRIFNPEAFCDLCNKEFCNKYFLKTHRANKHGIYSENTGSNLMDNLCTLPIANYFSNNNNSTNNNNNSTIATNSPISPLIAKKPIQPLPNSQVKPNSGSMRAYCNICQREFCNKYFVRRHKAKIHGIVEPQSQSDESQDQKSQLFQDKSDSVILDLNLPGPSSSKSVVKDSLEPSEEKLGIKREIDFDMEDPYNSQSSQKFLGSSWNNDELADSSNSPDRLKKSGSTGNSAFCDICCKEYCNKYFLRIHKQKCHGITCLEKEDKPPSGNNSKTGDSPLNLILREINKEQENKEISCKICYKTFANQTLLNSHCDQMHEEKCCDNSTSQINCLLSQQQQINNSSQGNRSMSEGSSDSMSETQMETHHSSAVQSDVQKIHSMITKMNHSRMRDYSFCEICNKDFLQTAHLENHIIKDHSSLIEEMGSSFDDENMYSYSDLTKYEGDKSPRNLNFSNIVEDSAGDQQPSDQKISMKNGSEAIDSLSNGNGDRQTLSTPTSSFCDICKKELCNKYFMKTHMQRMHGISIENGAQLGGVMCEICNKELCSKYFLRVHKQNSHGIVDENFLPQIGGNDIKLPVSVDLSLKPGDAPDINHRYFTHFTEVCSICGRRFRSTKWLKAHLLNDHGEEGKDKWKEIQAVAGQKVNDKTPIDPSKKGEFSNFYTSNFSVSSSDLEVSDLRASTSEFLKSEFCSIDKQSDLVTNILNKNNTKLYKCSYCTFSTPILALLFIHERNHVPGVNEALRCPICFVVCESSESLDKHICCHRQQQAERPSEEERETSSRYSTPLDYSSPDLLAVDRSPVKHSHTDPSPSEDKDLDRYGHGQVTLKCHKCSYLANDLNSFYIHIKSDHSIEVTDSDGIALISDILVKSSNNTSVPASFAVPSGYGNVVMQPFLMEEKAVGTSGSFLSSIVFLPVRDRIKKPITASFKLTPT